ncbi:MAG: phosphate acyltransferase PlsX [Candidatus Zophobacter franzmannii]|nr:phosphate acyltransferase PlsX [Candidatus Zophobacter franzmannii]
MQIALDAFGSDHAPSPEVEGAVLAIRENICDKIFLVGKEEILTKELGKYFYDKSRIEIVPASERIEMTDKAVSSVRKKKDSSLVRTVELHKDGIADAAVSAGNTGAAMSASLFSYKRIKNIIRPALAVVFPTTSTPVILLDVGANVDCAPEHLLQFAHLGSLYSKYFFKSENPRVSLLNIGEESEKGNELVKKTYELLTNDEGINFQGNIEGKYLLQGGTDIIVCDGFVGNVMLKTFEGSVVSVLKIIKEQIAKDWIAKIGALLSFPAYAYLKKRLDHTEYGGSLLVGVRGITIIGHGSSNATAIKNAIKYATKIVESGFVQDTTDYFERQ